ncbi:MAG: hypothetical protein L0G89_13685 [Janibacter sp.]|nr:hypothetical protein [Janibacter sp.]
MTMAGEALKEAREGEFAQGVGFGSLEATLFMETPSLRGAHRTDLWLRIIKAVTLIAPFAGLVAPLGNPGVPGSGGGMSSTMESDGLDGDLLYGAVHWSFVLGAMGQGWTILDWWRLGRHKDGLWTAWSAVALVSSIIVLAWFPSLLSSEEYRTVAPFVVATAVLALVALVAMRMWSRPPSRYVADRLRMEDSVLAVPEEERRALLAERSQVVEVLLERDLITPAAADVAARLELGQWWRLDDNAGPDHRIST